MSESWIRSWYNETFSNSPKVSQKEGVWDEIEARLKDAPTYWYTSNMENLQDAPKENSWDRIHHSLALLHQQKRASKIAFFRATCFVLLIISTPFFLKDNDYPILNATNQNTFTTNLSTFKEQSITLALNNKKLKNNAVTSRSIIKQQLNNKPQSPSNLKNTPNSDVLLEEYPENNSYNLEKTDYINNSNTNLLVAEKTSFNFKDKATNRSEINRFNNSGNDNVNHLELLGILEFENKMKPLDLVSLNSPDKIQRDNKWSIGLKTNLQFSTLQNPTTLRGMNAQSPITNKLTTNISYGLDMSYFVNPKWTIGVSSLINDTKTQRYKDFHQGKYVEKSLSINYQSLSFSYGRNLFINKLKPVTRLNLSLGIYGSLATSIKELRDNQEYQMYSDGIKNYDLGGTIRLSFTQRLYKSLHLNIGAYYSNGFINIFNGIDRVPANFYKTFTSSFGGSLGLQYQF